MAKTKKPIREETVITIPEAQQRHFPRRSDRTVYRWTRGGCNGVVLESFTEGDGVFTSEEAVRRFQHALDSQRSLPTDSSMASEGA